MIVVGSGLAPCPIRLLRFASRVGRDQSVTGGSHELSELIDLIAVAQHLRPSGHVHDVHAVAHEIQDSGIGVFNRPRQLNGISRPNGSN